MIRLRILSSCILAAALAADDASSQVAIGVHGGVSVTRLKLTGIDLRDQEPRRGFAAGASLTFPLTESFGLRLDASFLQKGAAWADGKLGDIAARVDYLQLAALGTVSVPLHSPRVSAHLFAGAAVARETSCEVKVEYALQPVTLEGKCTDEHTYNPTNATDPSLVGGAGLRVTAIGGVGVSLDFLYAHGLRSVYAGELERTVHNRGMTLQAGLVFPSG